MKKTFDLVIAYGLLILLAIRCCSNNAEWIVIIQYLGMMIAYADFFVETHKALSERSKYKYIYLLLLVIALIMVTISLIAITVRVDCMVGSKALDLVTIMTLFFSLPKQLFIKWLSRIMEEKDE